MDGSTRTACCRTETEATYLTCQPISYGKLTQGHPVLLLTPERQTSCRYPPQKQLLSQWQGSSGTRSPSLPHPRRTSEPLSHGGSLRLLRSPTIYPSLRYTACCWDVKQATNKQTPAVSLGFTILGENFAYVTFFIYFFCNPTVQIVIFRLRGWCMLGVSLFPPFTRLRHECRDLLSPCDGKDVCTD